MASRCLHDNASCNGWSLHHHTAVFNECVRCCLSSPSVKDLKRVVVGEHINPEVVGGGWEVENNGRFFTAHVLHSRFTPYFGQFCMQALYCSISARRCPTTTGKTAPPHARLVCMCRTFVFHRWVSHGGFTVSPRVRCRTPDLRWVV